MNALLDTHILLWWLTDDSRLSTIARECIANPDNMIWISTASAWEISLKKAKGKLQLEQSLSSILPQEGFLSLPVHLEETERAAQLPPIHSDPFDRMLIAQAHVYGYTLLTADQKILKYPAPLLDCR